MKGDFSRRIFRKNKHYRKVNMQQGRVQLDADWNEQNDIQFHYERSFLQDTIGKSGTLVTDPGFTIIVNDLLFVWENIPASTRDNDKLKDFLRNNFALDWITDDLQFVKSADGNSISISNDAYTLSITLASTNAKALLQISDEKGDTGQTYEFVVKPGEGGRKRIYPQWYQIGKGNYYIDGILCENDFMVDASRQPELSFGPSRDIFLFNWNSVPGVVDESIRLKNFLKQKDALDWITDDLQFIKSADGNSISISSSDSSKSASITLNSDNTIAVVTVSNNTGAVYKFIVKVDNMQIKIYYRMKNPYFPDIPGLYLAYLDVWEHHVASLDDPYILEQALGGVDTTTRTKIVWQVKLVNVSSDLIDQAKCVANIKSWKILTSSPTGKLQARSKPPEPAVNACSLIESAGYQRLENQLYRVEVHNSGTIADGATFKWSRDNGTVVTNVVGLNTSESKILIEKRSKDKLLDFDIDQWIELTDNLHELLAIPGTLIRIKDIKENTLKYDATNVLGDAITDENFPAMFRPKVRRWESRQDDDENNAALISSNTKKEVDGYIDLEDGVQIRLDDVGNYRTGDYWLTPARTRIGDIEWPRAGNKNIDEPLALLPEGVQHHYAPIAILEYTNVGSFNVVADCRNFFSSLSDLMLIQYVGGDSQQALPGNLLQAPLQVGVMLGQMPINRTPLGKAGVKFRVVQSNPQLATLGKLKSIDGPSSTEGPEITIETNEEEGIARCTWELGDSPSQQVKAVLLDECGNETDLAPIYFNATLPISFYYISGDGQEAVPGGTIGLSAGVRIGNAPVTSGYKVRFEVPQPGNGTVSPSEVPIGANGIARCKWTLDNGHNLLIQQATASLLFDNLTPTNLAPIYFNVTLPISFYYISGDGQEAVPGGTIGLSAGVRIGNAPVTSGYKVRFEVPQPGNGTLIPSNGIVSLDEDGIARCVWTLDNNSSLPRQQARALLLFDNLTLTPTNLAPIYFNAGFAPTSPAISTANTGLLRLDIPASNPGDFISTVEFQHSLRDLSAPPAVMLGKTEEEGSSKSVTFMEDCDFPKRNSQKWVFKAVDIDLDTFKILVRKNFEGGATRLVLRWWAVPAKINSDQAGQMTQNF